MGDAKEPASEFIVVAQAANMPGGGDEGLLDDVQACLLVMDQFKNINIERQLVSSKERVPGRGISLRGPVVRAIVRFGPLPAFL